MITANARRVVVSSTDGQITVDVSRLSVGVDTPSAAIADVWVSEDAGASDRAPGDDWALLPPPGGSICRLVEFKANTAGPDLSLGMHSTPTVDMGIVVSGEILLVLEDLSTVRLSAGDSIVLRGVEHTWANDTAEPCVVALVLVRSAD